MPFLDIFQQDQATAGTIRPEEAHDLPATFGETYRAAWSESALFGQSTAQANARTAVLADYAQELERLTGDQSLQPTLATKGRDGLDKRINQLAGEHPDLDLKPLGDDELATRALKRSQVAHEDFQRMAAREKGPGGGVGMFAGSLAGGATDPINLVAMPVAPAEGLGILATALRWGAIGGTTQAAIEATGEPYREQVQPGYAQSGAPITNVAEAALTAGGLGALIKGLGNTWTRVKTGEWPRSVRDAGNLVESEANVAQTNILPGIEGDVAHRQALGKAIDDVMAARPVDVDALVPPELAAATEARLEPAMEAHAAGQAATDAAKAERGLPTVPPKLDDKGDGHFMVRAGADYGDALSLKVETDAVRVGMASVAKASRGQGIAVGMYERAVDFAEQQGLPLKSDMSVSNDAMRVYEALKRRGYEVIEAPGSMRNDAGIMNTKAGYVYEVRKPRSQQAELPFTGTALEAQAETHIGTITDNITLLARAAGYEMSIEEATQLAQRVARAPEDEARAILMEAAHRPQTLADTLPSVSAAAQERRAVAKAAQEPLPRDMADQHTPQAVDKLRTEPELNDAMLRDLDRLRAEKGDFKIPMGETVNAAGERVPVERNIESVLAEADSRMAAANEIAACVGPQQEAAE